MRAAMLVLLIAAAIAAAQQPSAEPIHVKGRILTIAGQPLEGVEVGLLAPRGENFDVQPPGALVTTKEDGSFAADLPPAQYLVFTSKTGYIPQSLTWKIEAGKQPPEISLSLVPAAAIAGRVLDREGNPVPKAQVTVFRYGYARGARSLSPVGYPTYPMPADDAGEYRLPNLLPGRYYVRVEPSPPGVGTYYPSVLDPFAAAPIDVQQGIDRTGIDIVSRVEPVFHIRGKAVDPTGKPAANAALTILPEHPIETLTRPASVPAALDGSFEFKDLLPGRYIIRAAPSGKVSLPGGQLADALWAGRAEVNLTRGDMDDLEFRVNKGLQFTGTAKMEDGAPFTAAQVSLTDAEQTFTSGDLVTGVNPKTGAFRMGSLQPGTFYLRVGGAENVYVKSVEAGGLDVTRTPLDMRFGGLDNVRIVLGSKPGQVRVTVRNRKGEAVPRVAVVLWPDVRDDSSPNSGVLVFTTGDNGVARFPNLRPEKYYVAAFEDTDQAFLLSPEFLDRMKSRAAELNVTAGASFDRTLEAVDTKAAAAVIQLIP